MSLFPKLRRWFCVFPICSLALLATDRFATADDQAPPAGLRVFYTGHSFHMFVPNRVEQLVEAAGIEGHQLVGRQGIGGSRVIQHWVLPDDENRAKQALRTGNVDVFTMAAHLTVPDEGVTNFTEFGLAHNPNLRLLVQESWYPFDVPGENAIQDNAQRDDMKIADLEAAIEEWRTRLEAQADDLNERHNRRAVFIIPVGDAVVKLRAMVVDGEYPGVERQSELFRDRIGHAGPHVQALAAYCNFAAIYRTSPEGLVTPSDDLSDEQRSILQKLAWETVSNYEYAGIATEERAESADEATDNAADEEEEASSDEKDEDPIDFQRARELLRKRQTGGTLTEEEAAYLRRAQEARRRGQQGRRPQTRDNRMVSGERVGLKPLTEMTAEDDYFGEDGGLYGGGSNTPPEPHRRAAEAALAQIQPLNAAGEPADDGRIVLISISMSNATQEFSTVKRLADADPDKSSRLTIVDCAQGGQAMAEWAPPDARPWQEALRRLESARVTPEQVQVAWIKLANKGPRGELEQHGRRLEADTRAVIQNAKARFPNLRIAYLGSRIYAGYAGSPLNPEPYAYESAFVVRWLIQDQIADNPELNDDPEHGDVNAPLLLWGPYFWADGVTPRKSDGLVWLREDLAGDGTHPSESGRLKVAEMLLEFFKTDPMARSWFTE